MGVLDGVKVVELAEHGFVPSCGAILGDWGAEVVKVERPTGDPLRAVMAQGFVADTGDFNFLFELYNRNKRGITLDLRVAEGRAAFDRLIEDADVFITNFLPSAREKLHVTPDDLWKVNPRLVYAKGHGQGQRGPDADLGGFDAISFWARGSVGHILTAPDAPLVMPRGAFGDAPSGAMLAGGVAAALFERERADAEWLRRSASEETPLAASTNGGGKGVVVDTALLHTAVWQLEHRPHRDRVPARGAAEAPSREGAREPDGRPVPDRRRPLADAQHARRRPPLAAAVPRARHRRPRRRPALRRLRRPARQRRRAARDLRRRASARVRCRKRSRCSQPRTRSFSTMASPLEVIDDPQVVANGYLAQHPTNTRARGWRRRRCSSTTRWSRSADRRRRSSEHTEEVLGELGYSDDDVDMLRKAGAIA